MCLVCASCVCRCGTCSGCCSTAWTPPPTSSSSTWCYGAVSTRPPIEHRPGIHTLLVHQSTVHTPHAWSLLAWQEPCIRTLTAHPLRSAIDFLVSGFVCMCRRVQRGAQEASAWGAVAEQCGHALLEVLDRPGRRHPRRDRGGHQEDGRPHCWPVLHDTRKRLGDCRFMTRNTRRLRPLRDT